MLHTLSNSPWKSDINSFLRMLHKDDDLLLIQDGVLAAIDGSYFVRIFTNILIVVHALKEDIEARGLSDQISTKINIVNYIDFVNLTIKHRSQMNW